MINILIWIVLPIDFAMTVYLLVKKPYTYLQLFKSLFKHLSEIDENDVPKSPAHENEKNQIKRRTKFANFIRVCTIIFFIILTIGFIILTFSISLLPIWAPILFWIIFGWKTGLITLALSLAATNIIGDLIAYHMFKRKQWPDYSKAVVNDWMMSLGLILGVIFTIFGFYINLDLNIQVIINNVSYYPYFLAASFPVVLLVALISNIYLILLKVGNGISKKNNFRTMYLFLIFVISGFIAIVHLNNMDTGFLTQDESAIFLRNINIIQLTLTAILIPLLYRIAFQRRGPEIGEKTNG